MITIGVSAIWLPNPIPIQPNVWLPRLERTYVVCDPFKVAAIHIVPPHAVSPVRLCCEELVPVELGAEMVVGVEIEVEVTARVLLLSSPPPPPYCPRTANICREARKREERNMMGL
jgi:hypothetical protein